MRKLKNISRLLESINEETSVEDQFLSDLKRAIEYIADADKRLPSRSYKPSSMNCMRQSYYQLKGVTPDKNTSVYTSVGITNSGTDTHVRIQSYIDRMKDIGMDCEYVDVAEFVKERGLDYLDVKDKTVAETKLFHIMHAQQNNGRNGMYITMRFGFLLRICRKEKRGRRGRK